MNPKKFFIETYGCQMNVADSEVVAAILQNSGKYICCKTIEEADLILLNTCSIREKAEHRIWGRLDNLKGLKRNNSSVIIGVIGCMAERLGDKLLENEIVSVVAGPDNYRDIIRLIDLAGHNQKAINTELSLTETYDKIIPLRLDSSTVSGFVSITRGCNNFCTYCIVPYTRGRERSRNPQDILKEITHLKDLGYKEVTLLGQNVNSYDWKEENGDFRFNDLMELAAKENPDMRIRFTTSHPKDMSDETIKTIAKYPNICKHIHLPVQSGSSRILKLMNRKYDRQWYMGRINVIRKIIPECSITTDIFSGFCTEKQEDHEETLSLMKWANFDMAYMFKYSERPGTFAAKNLTDDVPEEVKLQRLQEMISLQNDISLKSNRKDIGKTFEVLTEGISKKNNDELFGRTSQNKVVVFPKLNFKFGDFVTVKIEDCTQTTLIGKSV